MAEKRQNHSEPDGEPRFPFSGKSWVPLTALWGYAVIAPVMFALTRESPEQFVSGIVLETAANFGSLLLLAAAFAAANVAAILTIVTARQEKRKRNGSREKQQQKIRARRLAWGLAILLLLAASIFNWSREKELPAKADGAYILAGDLGIAGKRIKASIRHDESSITYGASPWAAFWDVTEYFEDDSGNDITLMQEIYRCSSPETASKLLPHLMREDVFGAAFEKGAAFGGMDAVWQGNVSTIAVRGPFIGRMRFFGLSEAQESEALALLARRWEES